MTTLADLARVAAAATPGPWAITENCYNRADEVYCEWHRIGPIELPGERPDADSLFIAAFNPRVALAFIRFAQRMQSISDSGDCGRMLEDSLAALNASLEEKP